MHNHILEKFGRRSKCCKSPMERIVNLKRIKTYPGFEAIRVTYICLKCDKKEIEKDDQ